MQPPIRLVFTKIVICSILFTAFQACQKRGAPDTLVIAEESAPVDFDPRFAVDAYSSRINGLLYAGLVSQDTHARLVPDLALSWVTPDDQTYIFSLRPGVTFHDGRALTARDVVYTYQSILDPKLGSPKAEGFADVDSITAVDDLTVRFHLKRPFAPMLSALTAGIVPEGAGRELSRRPIGNGPFKLEDFDPGARTTLRSFADYYGGTPQIARLVVKAVPNDTTRVLELRKGSVGLLINSVPPDSLKALRAEPKVRIFEQPGLNVSYLGFNLRDPILQNRAVRQAIAHAIDREGIIAHLFAGGAVTTATLLAPMLWSHASGLPYFAYDPHRASQLLDAAGFRDPDGAGPLPRLRLSYKTSTNPLRRRVAEAIAGQLRAVGIEPEVRAFEFGTFFDDIKKGNFQMYSLVWVGLVEPDAYFNIFHSASAPPAGANRGAYADTQIDAWLESGRRTLDVSERVKIYSQIQERLAVELPCVPLWVQNDVAAATPRLRNFTVYPGGDYTGLVHASLLDDNIAR